VDDWLQQLALPSIEGLQLWLTALAWNVLTAWGMAVSSI